MDKRLKKLQEQIDELKDLENAPAWGARYQVWADITSKLVDDIFGDRGLKLFQRQRSVVLDDEAYVREIHGRKELLNRLIDKHEEYKTEPSRKGVTAPSSSVEISHSNFHFGQGNNFHQTSVSTGSSGKDIPLWFKYVVAVVTVLALVWGVYVYFFPGTSDVSDLLSKESEARVEDAVSISSILNRLSGMETSLERGSFLEKYRDTKVYGNGSFTDISKSGEIYYVYMYIGKSPVACAFISDIQTEQKLLLLSKGEKVSFYGTFTGDNLNVNALYITACALTS